MTSNQIKQACLDLKKLNSKFTQKEIAAQTGVTLRAVQAFIAGTYEPKKSWQMLFEMLLNKNKIKVK